MKEDNVKIDQKGGFTQIVDKIKEKIMGVNSDKVGDAIDDSLSRVSNTIINKDAANYSDMVKSVFADSLQDYFSKNSNQPNALYSYISTDRLARYNNCEEVVDKISYCSRALNVLTDEITAPDELTKIIIQIFSEENAIDDPKILANVKQIKKDLKLDSVVRDIVYDTLMYGDQFIEICDYTNNDVPLTQSLLSESGEWEDKEIEGLQESYDIKYDLDTPDPLYESEDIVTTQVFKIKPIIVEDVDTNNNKKEHEIANIRIIVHDSNYVIKLQTDRFKMCLGYLILPKYGNRPANYGVGSATGIGTGGGMMQLLSGNTSSKIMGVDAMYVDIMKIIKNKLAGKSLDVNKKEVVDMITRSVAEYEQQESGDFKIRFVAPDRMVHFNINPKRFFPYGESMFYKIIFSAKMLIALETALTIKRLSEASDKRIIYVEAGTNRSVRDAITEIKEAMKKRKISLDSMGNVGSIPSMITSYEDYYIPQVNGKRFVEFDRLEPTVSVREMSDELKYFRDILVAALSIPPSYLSLEENLCTALDTKISLTDGRTLTLQEVIDEYNSGKKLEVYSYDPEMGMVYTNPIKWAGKTRLNTELIRVHLDNGEHIDCTPDHPFMLRDGSYMEAQNLAEGQSLMPLYLKPSSRLKTARGKEEMAPINHKVVRIEVLSETCDTGDITVDGKNHNFATAAGVFVHNSNKNALSHENILFARTIISYQTMFSPRLFDLFNKIHTFIHKKSMPDSIKTTFSPPKMLQTERDAEYMRNATDVITSLAGIGINQEYLKKKYIPLDWDDLDKYESKNKLDKEMEKELNPPDMMGGGAAPGGYPTF